MGVDEEEGREGEPRAGHQHQPHPAGSDEDGVRGDAQPVLLPPPSAAELVASSHHLADDDRNVGGRRGDSPTAPSLPGSVMWAGDDAEREGALEIEAARPISFTSPFLHASPRKDVDDHHALRLAHSSHAAHRPSEPAAVPDEQAKRSSSEVLRHLQQRSGSNSSRVGSCASILLEGEADMVGAYHGADAMRRPTVGLSTNRRSTSSDREREHHQGWSLPAPLRVGSGSAPSPHQGEGEGANLVNGERASTVCFSLSPRSSAEHARSSDELPRRGSEEKGKRQSTMGEEGRRSTSGGEGLLHSMLSVRRASGHPVGGGVAGNKKKLWGSVKRAAVAQVAAEGGLPHRTVSMSKNALSAVTSTLLGGGASARPVRLADLEGRESWGPAESMQRALFLPAIESSFETLQSTGGGFRDFGLAFYGTLFDQQEGDSLRDEVFNGESLEVLSLKLHSGTSEMIRIAKMERPTELASRMMELGLTHLEYGVKEAHLEPYKAATLDCLRRVMVGRGLKWTRTQARAWGWMLELLGGLMMETLVEAGPKVARLRASWTELCAELHADQLAGGSKLVPFLSQSSLLRSFNNQLARGSFSRKNGISPSSQRNDRRNPFTSGEIEPLQEQQQQQEVGRGAAVRPLMMSPLSSLPNHHHHYQQQQQSNFASTAANDTPSSPTEQLATTVSNAADTVTVRADATAGITDDEGQPLPELEVATSPTGGGGGGGRLYSSTAATRGRGSVLGSLDKVEEIFSERWSGSDRELLLKPSDSGVGDRSSKSMEAPGGGGYSDRGGSQRATTTTTTTPSNATASLIGLVGVSRQVNKMKEKLKVMVASSRDSIDAADGGKLMTLWSKAHGNGGDARVDNVAHREGRRIAGRVLLSVMSASEPSLRAAVMQFHGRSEAKAEETLGNALELLVRCATRPHLLRDKLRLVALRHSRMGLGPEAAEAAEAVLFEFLPLLLQPAGRWDEATESAWRWNWDIVKTALVRHMKRSGRLLEALSRSWEVLEVNGRCEELGGRFYRRLFESAGEKMAALFARPEKMQHAMFQRALGLLVESMQEPETVQAELESIAMKHIKYDITREHIDIFGTVLVASLKDELLSLGEEHWNDEVLMAWEDTFGFLAEVFHRVICAGSSNLVSRALASSDANALSVALSHSARSRRATAAVEIRAAESTISPLLWTIRDGKLAMTEVLLSDILAIRGDRANYYYGRGLLWEKHPGLVRLLVEKAPRLLTVLLDGHMWTSRFIENGKRRVNFYIRELYGDPSNPETTAVSSSMLGMFVYRLPMTELHLFTHPLTTFIVDLKWRLFARRSFFTMQALNVANLCFATAYLQVGASSAALSFSLALAQVLCATARLAMYVQPLLRQLRATTGSSLRLRISVLHLSLRIPPAFHDVFVIINLLSGALCLTLFAYTWVADPFGWHALFHPYQVVEYNTSTLEAWATVTAFTTGLLWIQVAELLKASTKLSALYYAMLAVIGDVIRFLMLLGLWATGFAFILYWLAVARFFHEGYGMSEALAVGVETGEGAGNLVYYMLMAFLGLAGLEEVLMESWLLRILFCVCVITSVVVLLNLLISTMVSTYDLLQRSCNELAVKSLAQLVVRAEESLPWERRRAHFESLHLDQPLEFDANDMGPAGGIQMVIPVEQLQHPAYKVLDRVERYAGTTDPRAVWGEADLTSQAVVDDCPNSTSVTKVMETLLSDAEARITAKLLLELDSIKSALGINEDAESSEDDEGEGGGGGSSSCASEISSSARSRSGARKKSLRRRRRQRPGKAVAGSE